MWSRKSVKRRGKKAMKRNYWKTLLVSLILSVILGGASGASSGASGVSSGISAANARRYAAQDQMQNLDLTGTGLSEDQLNSMMGDTGTDITADSDIPPLPQEVLEQMNSGGNPEELLQFVQEHKLLILIILVIVLLIVVIAVLLDAFLLNPLELGVRRFFFMNLRGPAEIKEVAFGYDHEYLKNVKVIFLRDLYLFFWSLLFIIPGIIKTYSYRMVPYILADHPEMTRKEIFALSRSLMNGNKWKAFVLDLSFIGWYILSVLTLGILHVFFVAPYKNMTDAALYERLMYGKKPGEASAAPVALPAEDTVDYLDDEDDDEPL